MKALDDALYAKIAGSSLESDVNGRFYKGQAPDGAEFPYVVHLMVSDVPEWMFTERFERAIIQFSLFSSLSGSTEIEDMLTHLKALFDDCSLSISGSSLLWMRRENTILSVEDYVTTAGTQKVWAYHVDYEILMQTT